MTDRRRRGALRNNAVTWRNVLPNDRFDRAERCPSRRRCGSCRTPAENVLEQTEEVDAKLRGIVCALGKTAGSSAMRRRVRSFKSSVAASEGRGGPSQTAYRSKK